RRHRQGFRPGPPHRRHCPVAPAGRQSARRHPAQVRQGRLMVPRVWRGALVRLNRVRRGGWIDILLILGLAGLLFGLTDLFGQAWNMVFSFYHSLRSIPADKLEVASVFRFSAWQKAKWVELPSAAIGLIWNSMMSMAGGWVFLAIIETFTLGDASYRMPGIGS